MRKRKKIELKALIPNIIGLTAGGLAASAVDNMLLKSMDDNLKDLVKVGVGIIVPTFIKEPVLQGIGNGLVAVSAYNLSKRYVPGMSGIDNSIAGGAINYARSLSGNVRRTVSNASVSGKRREVVRVLPD